LFDRGYPRLNPAIEKLFNQVTDRIPPYEYDPDLTRAQNDAAAKAHYEKFGDPNKDYLDGLDQIRAQSWGRTAWNIAAAPTWVSLGGNADDLRFEGFTLWSNFAYGFENTPLEGRLQFLAQLRYREGESLSNPDDARQTFKQNTLFAGGRLRWGRPDLNFSVEGVYMRIWNGAEGNGDTYRLNGGIEKKLAENLWIVLSVGQGLGGGREDDLFALGSLRFGSSDSPNFAP
jgi:hypothetical protein